MVWKQRYNLKLLLPRDNHSKALKSIKLWSIILAGAVYILLGINKTFTAYFDIYYQAAEHLDVRIINLVAEQTRKIRAPQRASLRETSMEYNLRKPQRWIEPPTSLALAGLVTWKMDERQLAATLYFFFQSAAQANDLIN